MQYRAAPVFEVDTAMLARALGLRSGDVRQLLDAGRIRMLSERGTGADAGQYRLSFYYGTRRLRLLTNTQGSVLHTEVMERTR